MMLQQPRDLWTRIAVDPVADPLVRLLVRWPGVTPDRVTLAAAWVSGAAAACFLAGHPRWGGLLWLTRFFLDCVDGKVARATGTASARGALLDVGADVAAVVGCHAALGWWLVDQGVLPTSLVLGVMATLAVHLWVLEHRKHTALAVAVETVGAPSRSGGGWIGGAPSSGGGARGRWLRRCARWNVRPVPWSVEAEVLVLGLVPLLAPPSAGIAPTWCAWSAALAFYVVALTTNARRALRLVEELDAAPPREPAQGRHRAWVPPVGAGSAADEPGSSS